MSMFHRFAAGAVAAVAIGGALAGSASAQITLLPDQCDSGASHVTLNLGNPYPGSVSATSSGNDYYYSPLHLCRRFMVDIKVPSGKSLSISARHAGSVPLSGTQCNDYRQYERIYRRSALLITDFKQIASRTFRGAWVPTPPLAGGVCLLVLESGAPNGPLDVDTINAFGPTLFRMAVAARSGDWTPVSVTAGY
jgi:hypothetical protein